MAKTLQELLAPEVIAAVVSRIEQNRKHRQALKGVQKVFTFIGNSTLSECAEETDEPIIVVAK